MRLVFSSIDTWFFRDGTPFDSDGPQSGVTGVFPPYPPTVAGAVRAAFARRNGWDGQSRWSGDLARSLGDGPDDLGALVLTGPFVLHEEKPIFPMPRHVVGSHDATRWVPRALLRPGGDRVECDLGRAARLPALPATTSTPTSAKAASDSWVTAEGLARIVRGDLPETSEIRDSRDLWSTEPRIGIERTEARVTKDGALYSSRHVRPRPSVEIAVDVDGAPPSFVVPDGDIVPFGGESRCAECQVRAATPELRFDPEAERATHVALIALTPLLVDRSALRGEAPIGSHGLRVVSACIDRAVRIAGYDSVQRRPVGARNAVGPGGVLFCEVEDAEAWRRSSGRGLARIGERTNAGFGMCAIGRAPDWETLT